MLESGGLPPNKSRAFHTESSTTYGPRCEEPCRLAADATAHGLHGHKGQQGQVTGVLNGRTQGSLVLGANPALASRLNLGPVRDVPAQPLVILIVNVLDVFDTEGTDPPSGSIASPGPSAGSGTATGARATRLKTAGPGSGSSAWSGPRSCRSGSCLSTRGGRRSRWSCRCGCRCRHTCAVPPLLITVASGFRLNVFRFKVNRFKVNRA